MVIILPSDSSQRLYLLSATFCFAKTNGSLKIDGQTSIEQSQPLLNHRRTGDPIMLGERESGGLNLPMKYHSTYHTNVQWERSKEA